MDSEHVHFHCHSVHKPVHQHKYHWVQGAQITVRYSERINQAVFVSLQDGSARDIWLKDFGSDALGDATAVSDEE